MKKTIFIVILAIFTIGATTVFANKPDSKVPAPAATEHKLSDVEISRLTNRIKEIRSMDKSKLTKAEKSELRKEVKEIKETVKKDGVVIYLSGAAIVLIILLIILL